MPDNVRTYIEEHKTKLQTFWQARDAQMKLERSVISLTEPPKIQGFVQIILNDPKVVFATSVALLSGFEPIVRLPLSTQSPEEKDKMNKAERFLIGVLRELDRKQISLGKDRLLREMAYHICSGWYSVFPLIEIIGGQPEFSCIIYDPITVYPQWGTKGLKRLVRTYMTDRVSADIMLEENNWNIELKADQNEVEVVNYWEKDKKGIYNAVLIGGEVAKTWKKEPFLDIPIITGTVAGIPQTLGDAKIMRRGENVITANLGTYRQMNRIMSLVVQIIQDEAYPNLLDYTVEGLPALRKEDLGSAGIIARKVGEPVETLKKAGIPMGELNVAWQYLSGSSQRAGLPYIVFGGLPFEISGFALSQLFSAVKHKLAPYMNSLQALISQLCAEYMRQFIQLKINKIALVTESSKRRGKGETFIEDYSYKDIPKTSFVEVTIPLALTVDKAQQIMMARQALPPPALLSRPTLWDEFLDVQDAELEYERIIDDKTLELPIMQTITLIEKLKGKAEALRAKGLNKGADALDRYAAYLEASLAQQPGQVAQEKTVEANPELGMMNRETPEQKRAMMGLPRTGDEGREAMPEGGSASA